MYSLKTNFLFSQEKDNSFKRLLYNVTFFRLTSFQLDFDSEHILELLIKKKVL